MLQTKKSDALVAAMRMVLTEDDFPATARHIFDACCVLTGATSGYVALLSDDGAENEVLFLEAGGRPCTVDPDLPMPIRGLRGESYASGKAVYDNDFMNSKWMQWMPGGHASLDNVMFAPLNVDGKTVGIMGMANKAGDFTDEDAETATTFAEIASLALRNSRTRQALLDSERQYRSLVETMPSGVAVYEPVDGGEDFVFKSFNKKGEAIDDFEREQVIGRRVTEVFPGVEAFGLLAVLRRVHRTGEPEYQPDSVYTDGRTTRESWRENWVYRLPSGEIVAVYNDTTERNLAQREKQEIEEKLQQTQKLESLGVLAGGIAHDFNNLLMGVLGNASMALTEMSPLAPQREYLNEIETAARRAAELSRQMLAYSGKGRFMVKKLDVNELVNEMTHLLGESISKKAALELDLSPGIPVIEADVTQIRQLLMNIITNASEALGDRSGVVTIRTGKIECDRAYLDTTYLAEENPEGTYVFLDVSDTGEGMDDETLAKVFDPFFTTKFQGRGLGLAATLGIVRGHKGAIKVTSEPGKGTTFKVLLPALP